MENNQFEYTYSARQRQEIENIRKKYAPPPQQDKMARLRALDASVTQKATVLSLIIGIIGALVFGVGMCCTLVWQDVWFIPGIVIGVIGMALIGAAYPVYVHSLRILRCRMAPQILQLTDELMK